jgi:hypothetical protein
MKGLGVGSNGVTGVTGDIVHSIHKALGDFTTSAHYSVGVAMTFRLFIPFRPKIWYLPAHSPLMLVVPFNSNGTEDVFPPFCSLSWSGAVK